jgi:hypothetical protein
MGLFGLHGEHADTVYEEYGAEDFLEHAYYPQRGFSYSYSLSHTEKVRFAEKRMASFRAQLTDTICQKAPLL